MKTWVIDSGGNPRNILDPWVIDSGGVARKVKRIFVIDSGNAARLVFTANIGTWTLTAGATGNNRGYQSLGPVGTLNSSSFRSGIYLMANMSNTVANTINVEMGGFSGDPGQSYFTSFTTTAGPHTYASSSATYTFFAGGGSAGGDAALWSWTPLSTGMNQFSSYTGTLT